MAAPDTVLYHRYHQRVVEAIAALVGGNQALAEVLTQETWDAAVAVTGMDLNAVARAETIGAALNMSQVIVR